MDEAFYDDAYYTVTTCSYYPPVYRDAISVSISHNDSYGGDRFYVGVVDDISVDGIRACHLKAARMQAKEFGFNLIEDPDYCPYNIVKAVGGQSWFIGGWAASLD